MQHILNESVSSAVKELKDSLDNLIHERLKKIILYGSYSHGDYDNESDVDILILADLRNDEINKLNKKLDNLSADLSLKYNMVITPILKNINSFTAYSEALPFYNNIIKEGIVLYG